LAERIHQKIPFELILGYVPLAHQPSREANIPDINNRLARIKEAREEAQRALKQTQEKMIKETRFKGFELGNKVWLEGMNIKGLTTAKNYPQSDTDLSR